MLEKLISEKALLGTVKVKFPKKGEKECNSVDKSSELICLNGPGLANFTPQSHVFIYIQ